MNTSNQVPASFNHIAAAANPAANPAATPSGLIEGAAVATDGDSYLALYDLCGGNPTLAEALLNGEGTSSLAPPAPPCPYESLAEFLVDPPTWLPVWWTPPCRVPPPRAPTPVPVPPTAAPAPVAPAPAPAPATPAPTPAPAAPLPARAALRPRARRPTRAPTAGPSRSTASGSGSARAARHQPYPLAGAGEGEPRPAKRVRQRVSTRDYLDLHPASAGDMVRVEGHRELIENGHWRPIIADALRQIGVPYPLCGLQTVLKELYDGEGEQAGYAEDAEEGEEEEEGRGGEGAQGKRPEFPWRVSRGKAFFFAWTLSDDNFYRHHSLGTSGWGPRPSKARAYSINGRIQHTHPSIGGFGVCSSSRTFMITAY
jgi:hypothetical protein